MNHLSFRLMGRSCFPVFHARLCNLPYCSVMLDYGHQVMSTTRSLDLLVNAMSCMVVYCLAYGPMALAIRK
jgi:hypothetical protein